MSQVRKARKSARPTSGKITVAAAVAAGLSTLGSTAKAAQYTWTGASDTNFSNAANWSYDTVTPDPVPPPDNGDQARFMGAAAYGISPNPSNVGLTASVTVGEIDVHGTTTNFSLNGFTLNLNNSGGDFNRVATNGVLNFLGAGTVSVTGASRWYVGSGSLGTLTLDTGATLNWGSSNAIKVGYQGTAGNSGGTVNVKGGSTLNTTSGSWRIGDYASVGPAVVNVDGANSVITTSGTSSIIMPANAKPGASSTLNITNGGAWNDSSTAGHNFGTGPIFDPDPPYAAFAIPTTINISGANSKFDKTINGGEIRFHNGLVVNVTNGGLMDLSGAGARQNGDTFEDTGALGGTPQTSQWTVDGTNSKLDAGQLWVIAGRNRLLATGPSVNTVSNGAELVATGYNQAAVVVHPKGTLSLNNGTVRMGDGSGNAMGMELRNGAGAYDTILPDSFMATLSGRGTLIRLGTGGYEALDADPGSRISPGNGTGVGIGTTGTITIQGGALHTSPADASPPPQGGSRAQTILNFDLSTAAGNPHDEIDLTTGGQLANVEGTITYADIGIAPGASGFMDFITAGSIEYTLADLSSGDIPLNTDNLDTLMTSAGYTRTTNAIVLPGEYRYWIAQDVLLDDSAELSIDALRLEFAAIPEPSSLSLLAIGALGLAKRRRRSK